MTAGNGFVLSDHRRDHANANGMIRSEDVQFTDREVKILLLHRYGNDATYSFPQEANKSANMVFLKTSTAEMMADRIRPKDPLVQSAKTLRECIMEIDFGLQDTFCDKQRS